MERVPALLCEPLVRDFLYLSLSVCFVIEETSSEYVLKNKKSQEAKAAEAFSHLSVVHMG